MISLQQVRPTIGRAAYRWICWTSHLGCGHVEVAFYEEGGLVTFYAVRNMARANAVRLGCTKMAARLRLAPRHEDALVLTEVSRLLSLAGMKTRQAQPEECLRLALNRRLARGGRLGDVRRRIYRKYEKLHMQMSAVHGQIL